jgi:N-acetylmuramic acid 6-phosphate etherase
MLDLEHLLTETRNPDTLDIDVLPTDGILLEISNEDLKVAEAVRQVLTKISSAVDRIVDALRAGGRLIYLGAGTSGRLGMLDASECPPTYGTPPAMVQGLIAGGSGAMFKAVEGSEDSQELAEEDLRSIDLKSCDIVVGIAASGRTPYAVGGLLYAKTLHSATIALTCSPDSEMERIADCSIVVLVGPEAIMGSTRMKAGTAQKMVLNMLSTATMIRMGKVYSNLMVDLKVTNKKLDERARRIVCLATGVDREEAEHALTLSNGSVKIAITQLLAGVTNEEAVRLLEASGGFVSKAVALSKT